MTDETKDATKDVADETKAKLVGKAEAPASTNEPKPTPKTLMVTIQDGRKVQFATQNVSVLEVAMIGQELSKWARDQMARA